MSTQVQFESSSEGGYAPKNGMATTPLPTGSEYIKAEAEKMESYLQQHRQDLPKIINALQEAATMGGQNLSEKEFAFLAPLLGGLAKVALPALASAAGPLAQKVVSGVAGAIKGGGAPGPRPGGPVAGTMTLGGKNYVIMAR
jgi:hypothetical protein